MLECAVNSEVKWFINTGTFWQHYENSNYSPVNLYAATKQAFESIAQYYVETNQIWFCTLKLSDTFGPNDTRPKIFSIWDRISKTGETLDMSKGEQIIDISYIDDIVDAFKMLTMHMQHRYSKIKNGDVFAVKAEKLFTLKELAEIFQSVVKRKLNINWGARSYREREVMIPWNKGKVVPGWKQKDSIVKNIVKCYM
jgi:nucleoside-diphosphate-sugar epimerase